MLGCGVSFFLFRVSKLKKWRLTALRLERFVTKSIRNAEKVTLMLIWCELEVYSRLESYGNCTAGLVSQL